MMSVVAIHKAMMALDIDTAILGNRYAGIDMKYERINKDKFFFYPVGKPRETYVKSHNRWGLWKPMEGE